MEFFSLMANKGTKVKMQRASGFTLIELMVYIALLGGIVLIAGQAFSDSSKMRMRTQSMLQASEIAEKVAVIFKADVAQTGAKTSMEDGTSESGAEYGNKFSNIYTSVYMDPSVDNKDSSSFSVVTKNGFDSLTIRRLRYDESGHYSAVEQIAWFVRDGSLWRNCRVLEKKTTLSDDDPCTDGATSEPNNIEMASGVSKFKVTPGKPSVVGDNIQLFPGAGESEFRLVGRNDGDREMPIVTNEAGETHKGGSTQIISGFYQNYDQSMQTIKSEAARKINEVIAVRNETYPDFSWQTLCAQEGSNFTFEPNNEYEISFEILPTDENADKSKLFVPGEDHMSVGLRSLETGGPITYGEPATKISDFAFFPPLGVKSEGSGERSMRFSVPIKITKACLAFTFACYSPLVSQGKISISKLKVLKIPSANYKFENYDFEANKIDKQNVKAFLLDLDIRIRGESGHVELVVPTPSNGPRD